jgi:hypothetical protein
MGFFVVALANKLRLEISLWVVPTPLNSSSRLCETSGRKSSQASNLYFLCKEVYTFCSSWAIDKNFECLMIIHAVCAVLLIAPKLAIIANMLCQCVYTNSSPVVRNSLVLASHCFVEEKGSCSDGRTNSNREKNHTAHGEW